MKKKTKKKKKQQKKKTKKKQKQKKTKTKQNKTTSHKSIFYKSPFIFTRRNELELNFVPKFFTIKPIGKWNFFIKTRSPTGPIKYFIRVRVYIFYTKYINGANRPEVGGT